MPAVLSVHGQSRLAHKAGGEPLFRKFCSVVTKAVRKVLQKCLLFPFLDSFCDTFAVEGLSNLSELNTPCLFVSNHSSHADTAIILRALPERFRERLAIAAAADYFYSNKIKGALATLVLNTFPFDRQHPRHGLARAREVLEQGEALLIYPEGTRSKPTNHHCFKKGFALLAREFKVPVVPICVEGSYEMLPKGASWPRPGRVRICFGSPVIPRDERAGELTHLLEIRVDALASHS